MTSLNNQLEPSFLEVTYVDSEVENISGYENLYNTSYVDYREIDTSAVLNYKESNPSSFIKVNVPPDIKAENIAYKMYKDKSYWDILMMSGNKEMMVDMPKTNELLEEWVDAKVTNYFKNYQGNAPDEFKEAYRAALLERETETNLENQIFETLAPTAQREFLRSTKYSV